MRFAMQFVRSCMRSRVAWLLASIHAVWFFVAVEKMGPPSRQAATFLDSLAGADFTMFAGRTFHFTYQSLDLKALMVADLPAGLAQLPLGLLLSPLRKTLHIGTFEESYVSAALLFIVATCQWLVVGRLAEGFLARHFKGRSGG